MHGVVRQNRNKKVESPQSCPMRVVFPLADGRVVGPPSRRDCCTTTRCRRAAIQTPSKTAKPLGSERENKSGLGTLLSPAALTLALAQGDDDPIIGLPFDLHALYCARRRGIGGSTRPLAQYRPRAPTSSGPGMLLRASASACQCHRGAVAVSTGAVDLVTLRLVMDPSGHG